MLFVEAELPVSAASLRTRILPSWAGRLSYISSEGILNSMVMIFHRGVITDEVDVAEFSFITDCR